MKRVAIIGCCGSGKSTVAKKLARLTGIPLVHLDYHYWRPGWQRPNNYEWREWQKKACCAPTWIMDGNYKNTLDVRLATADTLIFLDYPTRICLWRVIKRTIMGLSLDREGELPRGCKERFDLDFLLYVGRFRKYYRPTMLEELGEFRGKLYHFTSPAELKRFMENCKH